MNEKKAKTRIEELIQLINYHNNKYYNEDSPEISDYDYDTLLRELESLEVSFPSLVQEDSPTKRIGGTSSLNKFKPVKHDVPMQSLHDSFTDEELMDFDKRVKSVIENPEYIVEPKIDGLSVSLEYKNSVLIRASTRGDGDIGEDVTENIMTIKSVPLKLNREISYLEVRGEVYMSDSNFLNLIKIQEENGGKIFKNPRNAAAGSLRQKNSDITRQRNLDIFIFNIQQIQGIELNTHKESLDFLKLLGFEVLPFYKCCDNIESAIHEIKKIGDMRPNLNFPIDGAVVKLNLIRDRAKVGTTSKFPKWAEAYKYPPEEKETQLLNIEINVGRTGVLTPTAILSPVLIGGSTVSRAVLHNEDFIKSKDIRVGDTVIIRKAGEIIPEIVCVKQHGEISRPFSMPTNCPSCGAKVSREISESAVRCQNMQCPAQLLRRLIHFVSKDAMDIETLGPSILEQLVKLNLVKSPSDLYQLKVDDISNIERMGQKSAQNIISAIEKSKSNEFYRLIFGLGIRHIGVKAAKLLTEKFKSIDNIILADLEDFSSIDGFGNVMANSLKSYFSLNANIDLINKLRSFGINMISENSLENDMPFKNKTFVLTGTLKNYKRTDVINIIENLGGKVTTAISKKTNFLLVGENAGSKLKKAKDLNIDIISEDQFEKLKNSR